jgi:hypothetical protein
LINDRRDLAESWRKSANMLGQDSAARPWRTKAGSSHEFIRNALRKSSQGSAAKVIAQNPRRPLQGERLGERWCIKEKTAPPAFLPGKDALCRESIEDRSNRCIGQWIGKTALDIDRGREPEAVDDRGKFAFARKETNQFSR